MGRTAILLAMRKAGKALVWAVSGIVCCSAVRANTPETGSAGSANPYSGIVDRNVFGLKPPPPPAPPQEPAKPPSNIVLTGITTLSGKKRCFITVTGVPRAGAPAAPESMMLMEGQREENIEIVSIDEKNGVVNLKEGEAAVTISFKENGVKGGPPPALVGGGAPAPAPGAPYQPNPFTPTQGQKMIPGRPLRIPSANQGTGDQNSSGTQHGLNPAGGSTSISPSSPQFS